MICDGSTNSKSSVAQSVLLMYRSIKHIYYKDILNYILIYVKYKRHTNYNNLRNSTHLKILHKISCLLYGAGEIAGTWDFWDNFMFHGGGCRGRLSLSLSTVPPR